MENKQIIKMKEKTSNRKNRLMLIILVITSFALIGFVSAQTVPSVCCEKTKSGLWCQNVPAEQCDENYRKAPTSCEATSYCKLGVCYDSNEGICADRTPQVVCNNNKGIWAEKAPAQCELGCCVLGDQAAFVTLVRCKKLSAYLGLKTNYKQEIKNEVNCVMSVMNQEKGACVYDYEFEKLCKLTTREQCGKGKNTTMKDATFFPGKLCSAEELGTKCGPTTRTTCLPGKDEVYFVDSCGNPANIYDASKINDKEYWTNIKDKTEVCGKGNANMNSKTCGNCNYLLGSYCRQAERKKMPMYGEYMCADLNCYNTQNGKNYKHGESWCVYTDKEDSVGSRYYKHICINGEEVLEQCADFRQHVCIEDKIGDFSQAACRVNRWQDCIFQNKTEDCENSDKRDCKMVGKKCVPKIAPGLIFWEGAEASAVCNQANDKCVITKEKSLIKGTTESGECADRNSWIKRQLTLCQSLGDCGAKVNWIGVKGMGKGYDIKEGRWKEI
ncbi:MAG: hypothetical protein N3D20_02145 [Candidatus Pacearchaeota archaeon]|nr:hypothetical protein [Candidatus Pacearchaeota archaeon]